MKKVSKAITVGVLIFVVLGIILLLIINSNIPTKMSCEDPNGGDVISCDMSIFYTFQTIWIIVSVLIAGMTVIAYYKFKK